MSEPDVYPRDMVGYGRTPPDPWWLDEARIAVQFVVHYEEGSERNILHGDDGSEANLTEIIGTESLINARNMSSESIYEYGSRSGFWRLWRTFTDRKMPVTAFATAMALTRNDEVTEAMVEAEWEIAGHGLRWIDNLDIPREVERDHMEQAVAVLTELTGSRPLGWYSGRASPRTRDLVIEEGGFLYDSDSYADDLPYWVRRGSSTHLVVPYALDTNDMRFATAQGFNSGDQFYSYLRDAFDVLYAEGATQPKMMSVGLHPRLAGRPGRLVALNRFLDHIGNHDRVWVATRADIARHWAANHPAEPFRPISDVRLAHRS